MKTDAKPRETWMSWSSGKDSAFALSELLADTDHLVRGLLTTVTEIYDRVSMHGVRRDLLHRQAEAIGLPLYEVMISRVCVNQEYEEKMGGMIEQAKSRGVTHMAFGDLFLPEVRTYRERQLASTGIQPVFPLWLRPTPELALEMIDSGIKAVVTCVDPRALPPSFAGRHYDRDFLRDLPASADPCGENGEFHTFVYDAPIFKSPIPIEVGETVERDGFIFADILGPQV